MKRLDLAELLALAAVWGASFLFMRLGAAEFGPVALAAVRVVGASLFLMPVLAMRGEWPALRRHWKSIFFVGLTNSAIPFLCFSYAALSITAGLSSIFNATTPLWGALIAWLWLKDKLTPWRVLGLVIGFAGVLGLAWEKASFKPGAEAVGFAVLACLAAPLLYGFSASFTKKRLTGVPPMALAAGSQLSSAIALVLPGVWLWPAQAPSAGAWAAAVGLALLCTGVAYIMYFRLIANVGPANAISVTFLVPAFAVLWGALFLHEAITPAMVLGCSVILAGTALATGVLKPRVPAAAAAAK
ncbi:DMT family transporter [Ideonella sp. BN130291]|uniref:DMT family transporter n=1 Tax=Ideonella sp. BN130291 TaxID=3112940 RepID=UPI002E264A90|nr:DMT family transporter [Ideonella sp. BN130291]